jgi:hypothetical protein
MVFEIHKNKSGSPVLKRVDRLRRRDEGRGMWVEIGRSDQKGIERFVAENEKQGYLVLMDDQGVYRALILTY